VTPTALPAPPPTAPGGLSWPAIAVFFLVGAVAVAITALASRRTRVSSEYYAPTRQVSPVRVGLALAGEYVSAASFLGIAGLVALSGFDGMIYAAGWLAGWPALTLLVAEPLRNLGRYTVADAVAYRLRPTPVRLAAALGGLVVVVAYTVAQMVAAGSLVSLLFGFRYPVAELIVGAVLIAHVLLGGAAEVAWVQIVKAVMLLGGVTLLAALTLAHFGWDPGRLYAAVAAGSGAEALQPGGLVRGPVEALSLGMALMFGLLGLPHILMRFYAVPDARAARRSVRWATGFIAYFYLAIPVVGFGAAALVGRAGVLALDPGGNMAAPALARALAGAPLLGLVAAVAFATILAAVAGLTLAGASTYTHDIYVHFQRRGRASDEEQVRSARFATVALGATAVVLGIGFEGRNVAVLVGLAFAIAASANFPALLLSLAWRRFSTAGAVASIATGTVLSVGMILLGPTVWSGVLALGPAPVALENPCIASMPAAFLAGILASLAWPEEEARRRFDEERLRATLGVGPE